jgi:hypothetical protein
LGQIANAVYVPVVAKGVNILIGVLLMRPGFAKRSAGLELVASGAIDDGTELYNRGGQLIQLAAQTISSVDKVIDYALAAKGAVDLFKTSIDDVIVSVPFLRFDARIVESYRRLVLVTDEMATITQSFTRSVSLRTVSGTLQLVARDYSNRIFEAWGTAVSLAGIIWNEIHE